MSPIGYCMKVTGVQISNFKGPVLMNRRNVRCPDIGRKTDSGIESLKVKVIPRKRQSSVESSSYCFYVAFDTFALVLDKVSVDLKMLVQMKLQQIAKDSL